MMSVPDTPGGNDDLAASALSAAAEEIARLRAENATLRQTVAALTAHVAELEHRLGLNSRNSGKPPSSDGLKKPPRTANQEPARILGQATRRKKGHPGETLRQVAGPSVILDHYPERCLRCGSALTPEMSTASSARQVFDRPEP